MTSTNQLEFKGSLKRHPVDELLVEFYQKGLTGSLRMSSGDKKSIAYFDGGNLVFVVSNAKRHRLFEILLKQGQIEKKQLAEVDQFTNDLHLAKELVEGGSFTKPAIDSIFAFQFSEILNDTITWDSGEFVFSASARIKADICFDFDLQEFLSKRLETLPEIRMLERLNIGSERFGLSESADINTSVLKPEDAFLLSRLSGEVLTADMLSTLCGMDQNTLVPMLYRLWFKGLIKRIEWDSAIGTEETEKLASAKFELKQSAKSFEEERAKAEKEAAEIAAKEAAQAEAEERQKAEKEALSLEQYLESVENAATHYEIFDVGPDADIKEIKKAYFLYAKRFHPDLHQKNVDEEIHQRVQDAFTETAQAYETLKDPEAREIYDFKLGKVLEQLRESGGKEAKLTKDDLDITGQANQAKENFDSGYDLLLEDEIEKATPYLARAAHLEPENAKFRAFYGRALSFDSKNLRKAEAEFQAAVKLDSKNATYRLMLAELYIEIGLKVRARGELNRLLKFDPNNNEARNLLDTLSQ